MALDLYWYDFICYSIVVLPVIGSICVLFRKEGCKETDSNGIYETLMAGRPQRSDGYVSESDLWKSCWKGVSPFWLMGVRFASFLIMFCFMSWDVYEWTSSIFAYYTEWTFSLVIVYFALGTVMSAYGCWVHSTESGTQRDLEESEPVRTVTYLSKILKTHIWVRSHYEENELQGSAGLFGYILQVIYQTCGGAVILTDLVFWCAIFPYLSTEHSKLNPLMACMHSVNLFFILVDTSLNNLRFPLFRLTYFILWTSAYVIFQWVMHACGQTWWPYPFLKLSTPWAPLWYFIVAFLHVPCYGVFVLIVRAKYIVFPRLFPSAFLH